MHQVYPLPVPLGAAAVTNGGRMPPWAVPVIELPPRWCKGTPAVNHEYFQYANHPCHNWNATAAPPPPAARRSG